VIDTDPQGTCRMWAAESGPKSRARWGLPSSDDGWKKICGATSSVCRTVRRGIIDCPPGMGADDTLGDARVRPRSSSRSPRGPADVWALRRDQSPCSSRRVRMPRRAPRCDRLEPLRIERRSEACARRNRRPRRRRPRRNIRNAWRTAKPRSPASAVVDYAPESDAAFEVRRFTKAVLAAVGKAA